VCHIVLYFIEGNFSVFCNILNSWKLYLSFQVIYLHFTILCTSLHVNACYYCASHYMTIILLHTGPHCLLYPYLHSSQVNGVTLAQSRQSLDLHSSITHDAPGATSRQKQRNVIGECVSPQTPSLLPLPALPSFVMSLLASTSIGFSYFTFLRHSMPSIASCYHILSYLA
jgi:SUF system FeS cluster assembly, SufBD